MTKINMDLPESRWTKEAILESVVRYRRLLDNSPDMIFRMSLPDRKFEYVSPAAEQLTGYPPEDFYSFGGLVEKLIHPDWKEYFTKQWEALLAGKITPLYEYQVIDRAGLTRWFHQRNMVVMDESGHPVALEGIILDITARRLAEMALQKSEGKLNAMLQSVADPMSMMDKDLNIIWANETTRQYFGEDLIGRKCYQAYHNLQNPCGPGPCLTLRAFQDNEVHRHETTMIDTLGKTHFFECTANVALKDENGKAVAVLEISRDITERKRAEKALQENEEKYRSLVETTGTGYVILDNSGKVITANQEYLRLTGRSDFSDIIGKNIALWTAPHDLERNFREFEQCLRFGSIRGLEIDYLKPDGTIQPVEVNSSTVQNESRQIIISLCRDITDRRLAVTALKREQEFTNLLLDTSPVFIVAVGTDGCTIMMNKAMSEALEYTPEEVRGASYLTTFVPEEDRELVGQVFREIVHDNKITINENRVMSKSGKIFSVEWRGRPMKYEGYSLDFFVGVGIDITERKKADEALRNSERDFRSIIENISDGFYRVNNLGTLSIVSPSAARIFGYNHPDEVLGLPLDRFWAQPEQRNDLIRTMQENGGVSDYEIMALKKDRKAFPVSISCKYYKDEHGSTQWYEGIVRDISERKRAELVLTEREHSYRTLAENLSGIVYRVHVRENSRMQFFNKTLVTLTGYNENELVHGVVCSIDTMIVKDDRKRVTAEVETAIREKRDFSVEYRIVHKDGGIRFFNERGQPVFDNNGLLFIDGIIHDITAQKQTEEALKVSEQKYRNVVEDQTEFICRFLPDDTLIFVNDAYCRYFDKKREEIIGHRFRPVLHPDDRDIVARHLASITPEHPLSDIDQRIIMPDGNTRWQRWSYRAIFDPDGRVVEYQSVGRDITEQKRAEEALHVTNKKLKLLTSITRHDISNQLTILRGYLPYLEKEQPGPQQNEYFRKVTDAAQRVSAMIQFTKEYEQIGVIAPAWEDCHTLVEIAEKETQLGQVVVKNDIPAGTEVFADQLIVKVFYNLMDNAARYGGKITTIRFSAEESGDDYLIVCEDDGDGILTDQKEKIFEKGFGKNTGIGLFLAREILDITGITIRETGEPGKGARFEISVPKGMYRCVHSLCR